MRYKQKIKFELKYKPKESEWDKSKNELKWDHPYYYTLNDVKKYISSKLEEAINIIKKEEVIKVALTEIEAQISTGGIEQLAEFMFDWGNKNKGIPKYSFFIEAFKYFQELRNEKGEPFEVQTVGEVIYFRTSSNEYIMNTYEGKTKELRFIIDNKAYDEIYTMTDENIWSEIYLDAGIEKEKFLPVMLNLWENYWDDLFERIEKQVGNTKHLNGLKERSWRQF